MKSEGKTVSRCINLILRFVNFYFAKLDSVYSLGDDSYVIFYGGVHQRPSQMGVQGIGIEKLKKTPVLASSFD